MRKKRQKTDNLASPEKRGKKRRIVDIKKLMAEFGINFEDIKRTIRIDAAIAEEEESRERM